MSKQNFLILSIVSLVLVFGSAAIAKSSQGAGLAAEGIGALVALVTWIMGLVKTAQLKRWGWFVAVLLLGTIGTLIYGVAGSEQPRA